MYLLRSPIKCNWQSGPVDGLSATRHQQLISRLVENMGMPFSCRTRVDRGVYRGVSRGVYGGVYRGVYMGVYIYIQV